MTCLSSAAPATWGERGPAGIHGIRFVMDSAAGVALEADAGLCMKKLCGKSGPVKPCRCAVTEIVMRPFLKKNCQRCVSWAGFITFYAAHFALVALRCQRYSNHFFAISCQPYNFLTTRNSNRAPVTEGPCRQTSARNFIGV